MASFGYLLYWACTFYIFVLLGRVVFDLLMIVARDWQPRGLWVVFANIVYMLTDPPLRLIGRYIKPLQMGSIALDLGFIVLFIAVQILQRIALMMIY
ncbi:MAG: YggT family protein [Actinomycetaceae bacterium]|nr:YggT family protein [Actinomycetaceae bacterium]